MFAAPNEGVGDWLTLAFAAEMLPRIAHASRKQQFGDKWYIEYYRYIHKKAHGIK